jgi:hypothetical protein
MIFVGAIAALLFVNYLWNGYKALQTKHRLNVVQSEWAKVEPKVTAAQKRAEELTKIIDTTRVLDGFIDGRFYWAPLLENISRCVAPNNQLTSLEGSVLDEKKGVSVTVEGVAAGREPRAAAEDDRQVPLPVETGADEIGGEHSQLERAQEAGPHEKRRDVGRARVAAHDLARAIDQHWQHQDGPLQSCTHLRAHVVAGLSDARRVPWSQTQAAMTPSGLSTRRTSA